MRWMLCILPAPIQGWNGYRLKMNIQDLPEAEMNKLRCLNPEVHALLERIFQYKDGKGDYSVDRYRWLETFDEETFLNEVRHIEASKL